MDIAIFNQRLLYYFGKYESTDYPKYRLCFSSDEKEKRVINIPGYSPYSETVPKYPQIKPPKYILESLQYNHSTELAALHTYEPLWVFGMNGDPNGEPIEPTWVAIEYILHTLYHRSHSPYLPTDDGTLESRQKQADELFNSLFGNETNVGDALAHKEGVTVPRNFGE
jgi:hypothetical protein